MGSDRLHKVRKPYKGESEDHRELEKDLHEDLKGIENALIKTDEDLDTAQAAADAAQATADLKAKGQLDGAQKTDTGTAFTASAGTWADIPGTGGSGAIEKTIITTGGKVKASLTVNWHATGSQEDVEIRIMADAVDGVQIAGTHLAGTAASGGAVHEVFSPAAGSHTYKARGRRIGGDDVDVDEVDLTVTEID